MYGLSLEKIAQVLQGTLIQGNPYYCPVGAAIDTRKIRPGELFFALTGEKTDGHKFLDQARENGAAGAVVARVPSDFAANDFSLLMVDNVAKALQQLAAAQRQIFNGPVIAITGSTGKTTTKDMLWSILNENGPVQKTVGNYNNELGLPLTILSLTKKHWALILEMGMRGLGEIDFLACIGKPSHGIITNIGHTHQEILGTRERIAQAKAELISHIPYNGGLVLNTEDKSILKPWLSNIRSRVTWVGMSPSADLFPTQVEETKGYGLEFSAQSLKGDEARVVLKVPGKHNIQNALAAAGIALQLGLSWDMITSGLAQVKLTAMRLQIEEIPGRDILIINDAYNANPASMQSALEVLYTIAGGRRMLAVLGDMYELGDYSLEGHLLVGRKAKEVQPAYLITVGKLAFQIGQGAHEAGLEKGKIRACQNNQEALSYIKDIIQPGDVILVKGSRGVKMENIVTGLIQEQEI